MSNAVIVATIAIVINSVSLALVIGKIRKVEKRVLRQELRMIKARINAANKGGNVR